MYMTGQDSSFLNPNVRVICRSAHVLLSLLRLHNGPRLAARNFIAISIILIFFAGPLPTAQAQILTLRAAGASNSKAQSDGDVLPLERGNPVERELGANEKHRYRIALAAGQYLRVALDPKGKGAIVALIGPDGKKLTEIGGGSPGTKSLLLAVTEAAGDYRLEVRALARDSASISYSLKIEELREATEKDRSFVAAGQAYMEGERLRAQPAAESLRNALEKYKEAASLYRIAGDRAGEAVAINQMADAYSRFSDHRKAIDYYDQAISLYHDLGNRTGEAKSLAAQGLSHQALGDHEKALDGENQALAIVRETGDRIGEATVLNYLGIIYKSLDDIQRAIDHFDKALTLSRALRYKAVEAQVLNNMAGVYGALGENEKAIDYYDQALRLARSIGNRAGEATTLNNIAMRYSSLSEYRKSLEYLHQALEIYRAVGFRRGEAAALNNIGRIHTSLDEMQKAIEYFDKALIIVRANGERAGEANVLNNLGGVYSSLGENPKALDYLNRALTIRQTIGDRSGEAQARYDIARVHRGQGDLISARLQSEAALNIVESLRGNVLSQESRASYFASVRKLYDLHIDMLMRSHRNDSSKELDVAAFETSERARARSLLELLAEARADIRQGIDAALLERERSVGELLNAKAERQTELLGGKHTPEQAAAVAKEIEELITEYRQVQARIRAASPRYAALTQPQPASLKEIQQKVLDPDTLLLEYALGDESSYLWAVSADSMMSYELPGRREIETAARHFYELVRTGDSGREDLHKAALQLSQMLLSPAVDHMGFKRLVVVADGVLHYIPFAALPLPEASDRRSNNTQANRLSNADPRPLIVDHEIISLPSASVLLEMRRDFSGRKPAAKVVAVFADPVFSEDDPRLKSEDEKKSVEAGAQSPSISSARRDLLRSMNDLGIEEGFPRLPFTRREAQAILAVVPSGQSMRALDFQASRDAAIDDDLSDYRIIHFATHGLLNGRQPELSGIVFSLVDSQGKPLNGFLRLHEIYNMKLPAELVVLSACQTGLGKEIRGEGIVGLTRGFMYAGAARVLASLWKVDDAATAELMKRFYTGMLVKKLIPAAALREAQIEMWKQPRWRSPYYWAAFVLQGEWR